MIKKLEQLKKEFESLTNQLKTMNHNDTMYNNVWDQRVDIRWAIIEIEQKIVDLQIKLVIAMELGNHDKANIYRNELINSGLLSSEEIDSLIKYV